MMMIMSSIQQEVEYDDLVIEEKGHHYRFMNVPQSSFSIIKLLRFT